MAGTLDIDGRNVVLFHNLEKEEKIYPYHEATSANKSNKCWIFTFIFFIDQIYIIEQNKAEKVPRRLFKTKAT